MGGDEEPSVSVQGFADYKDVTTQDLVPWTPLRTSQSVFIPPPYLLSLSPVSLPFVISLLSPSFSVLHLPSVSSLPSVSLLSVPLPPFCLPSHLPPVPSLPSLLSPSLLFPTSLLFPPSSLPLLLPHTMYNSPIVGSRLDKSTALFILCEVVPNFIAVLTEEAKTLPNHEGQR